MFKYTANMDVGELEHWPFDNPASDYRILSGAPVTSGRIDKGGAGHVSRCGIWRCTVGASSCIEQSDELFTVLSGRGVLINHTEGTQLALAAGDSVFVQEGARVTWDIREDLTKVFYGSRSGGVF